MSVVVDADVMESFHAVAQGLDLDESLVEFVSEKPVFAPQRSTTTTIADAQPGVGGGLTPGVELRVS
jgi:hypothetical protein